MPQQPAHWIFYVYGMCSHKNCCDPIPTTARMKAVKFSVKTEGKKVPNSSSSICYIKCLLVTALESNYSLIAV